METQQCVECGDFPVNHLFTYLDKTFAGWEHDRIVSLGEKNMLARLSALMRTRAIFLGSGLIRALHFASGGRTQGDPARASTTRAQVIWEEAVRRGMKMEQLMLFGAPIDSYRMLMNDRWVYFESLPIPPALEARSFQWADDKYLFKQFLKAHRLPAAQAAMATNLADALVSLTALTMPVVVKPRLGSNSRHTTPRVHTRPEFEDGFRSAQQLGRYVLFEEYFYGNLCRATVIGGSLVGFLESRQPRVTGNGIRSVRELILDKNAHRYERISEVLFSAENEAHISRQGYTLDSILESGVSIEVARLPGRLTGGETREMPAEIHPKLRDYVEKTARLLQTSVVGFDLIIPDPEADPDGQKWGILEANTVPFIEIHSDPLYGEPSNVAAAVWDLWKKEA